MEQVAAHVAQELLVMNGQTQTSIANTTSYLKESAAQVEILQLQAHQAQTSTILSAEGIIHSPSSATHDLDSISRSQCDPKSVFQGSSFKHFTQNGNFGELPSNTIQQGGNSAHGNYSEDVNSMTQTLNQETLEVSNRNLLQTSLKQTVEVGSSIKTRIQESNSGYILEDEQLPALFYVKTVAEVNSAVHSFEKQTGTKYSCYKNTAGFGNTEYNVNKPHKIYFEERSLDLCGFGIPFDGIPFINLGKKVMDCEYGIDRCVAAKRKYMERHLKDMTIRRRPLAQERTKKIKCRAQIRMKEILKYPEFKVSVDSTSRKKKVNLSIALREALKNGTAKSEKRIYIQFPRISDHKDHPMGENTAKEVRPTLSGKQALKEINILSWDGFIQRFGNVVEHGHIVASAAWTRRPFLNMKALLRAFCEYLDALPNSGKEALFRCYPNLEINSSRTLSADSFSEFQKIGLQSLSSEETALLTQLNTKYRDNFHFPYIVCMQETNKEELFTGLQGRTQNSQEIETLSAMKEVKKIAWYRILDQVRMKTIAASSLSYSHHACAIEGTCC